jgi:hypothetical protein
MKRLGTVDDVCGAYQRVQTWIAIRRKDSDLLELLGTERGLRLAAYPQRPLLRYAAKRHFTPV